MCELEAWRALMERLADTALELLNNSRPPGVSAEDDGETLKVLATRASNYKNLNEEAKRRGCTLLQKNLPFAH